MSETTKYGLGERPQSGQKPEVFSGRRSVASTWVEVPSRDCVPTAWLYSDRIAYRSGDEVVLFISANVPRIDIRIYRDGAKRELVHEALGREGVFQDCPADAYMNGCRWAESYRWPTHRHMESGGYLVEVRDHDQPDLPGIGHHLVLIRGHGGTDDRLALVAATATWRAYNDFGGANHYRGIHPSYTQGSSPVLALDRPWCRGQVWLPEDAPRLASADRPRAPRPARYEAFEYAHANGFARNYAASGWASFERLFVQWAEENGYKLDIFCQEELHEDRDILNDYRCVVFVGHCEYWSREMRETVHAFLDQGGNVARFAGNFLWQIRLDEATRQQVCYKYNARTYDPVADTKQYETLTSAWEDPLVDWPGAATFGVNALRGIYAGGLGAMAPRAPRGFQVFAPEHWAFERTGLGYAEMFGDEHNIFSYEVDGLNYTFRDGLPEPVGDDGAPAGLRIIAMGWATLAESGLPEHRYAHAIGATDAVLRATILEGKVDEESVARHSRGSGMIVSFRMGAGEVFTAATCEWVNGLKGRDFYTSQITKNVLDRFMRRAGPSAVAPV
jgi:hypothetical protein